MRIRSSGRLAEALARERGVALPVALSVMFVVMSLTGVAATSAITATHQSERDLDARRALAAAQAGISVAVDRLNRIGPQPDQCVVEGANGLTIGYPDSNDPDYPDWCPPQSPGELGDDESFIARTSSGTQTNLDCQSTHTRKVVSSGFSGDVARRAIATVTASTGPIFGVCGIVSLERFSMTGPVSNPGQPYVRGDIATNGDVALNKKSWLCGDVHAADLSVDPEAIYDPSCGEFTQDTTQPYSLSEVSVPDCLDTPTSVPPGCNDNERIAIGGPDPLRPHNDDPANVIWNATNRELTLKKTSTLTLTGKRYRFCAIRLEGAPTGSDAGSRLYIAPRNPSTVVKIYFDPPEQCPGQLGKATKNFLSVVEKAAIINSNPDPTTLQIYMVGTDDPGPAYGTKMRIDSNPQDVHTNAVFFAPRSKVVFKGQSRLYGAVAAKEVEVNDKARVIWSDDVMRLNGSNFSVLPSFATDFWTECAPAPLGASPTTLIEDCRD